MAMLSLEIITPEKVLVKEEVDMVEGSGALGEFGILPGHTQFLTILEVGEVRYTKGGTTTFLATSGGFGEVVDDKVTFLLDTGEFAEDIDVTRAQLAMEETQERLKELSMDTDEYRRQELALLRAIARIKVASSAKL
jgi:F-type H+-transporting ATPase subunit epsilon